MSNLFKRTSSNWARYDKYEWKEDKEGTLYITPSPDAKVSLYNPLKDSEQIVLKAVNLGLMCMDKIIHRNVCRMPLWILLPVTDCLDL